MKVRTNFLWSKISQLRRVGKTSTATKLFKYIEGGTWSNVPDELMHEIYPKKLTLLKFKKMGYIVEDKDEPAECICEYEELEKGDTLFKHSSWEGGYEFKYIRPIRYCPVCGKELPGEEE